MSGALSVSGLSKHHGPIAALRDVSLTIERGTVHGLVGGNGAGKSTLVKILAGVSRADAGGTIRVGGETVAGDRIGPAWSSAAGLRFVHQDLGVFLDLSVAENLMVDRSFGARAAGPIPWRRLRGEVAGILRRFEVAARPDQLMGELSAPDRTLVAIARALREDALGGDRILVLDEPTACLPSMEADRLLDTLRRLADDGHTIILISHRLNEIVRIADAVSVLRDGALAGTLHGEDVKEARLIELITGAAPVAGGVPPTGPVRRESDTPVLQVSGLKCGRLADVSFTVAPGEILGVAGLLGSGRTRLLRALYGAVRMSAGEVFVDGTPVRLTDIGAAIRAGIAYVPEDRSAEAAFGDMTVGENLTANRLWRYWHGLTIRRRAEAGEIADMLTGYAIRASGGQQIMSTLSGGNQQKAVMARALRADPRVLLLDEPSQGVDVHSRLEIQRMVRRAVDKGNAAVIVSSDFEELAAVADRVVVLRHGRVAGELDRGEISPSSLNRLAFATLKEAV